MSQSSLSFLVQLDIASVAGAIKEIPFSENTEALLNQPTAFKCAECRLALNLTLPQNLSPSDSCSVCAHAKAVLDKSDCPHCKVMTVRTFHLQIDLTTHGLPKDSFAAITELQRKKQQHPDVDYKDQAHELKSAQVSAFLSKTQFSSQPKCLLSSCVPPPQGHGGKYNSITSET